MEELTCACDRVCLDGGGFFFLRGTLDVPSAVCWCCRRVKGIEGFSVETKERKHRRFEKSHGVRCQQLLAEEMQ